MKYYLDNISLFILRLSTYNDDFDDYYTKIIDVKLDTNEYSLLCDKNSKDIIYWIKEKEIFFDKKILLEDEFGRNISIFGCHVFLLEEDEQFLFYQKLKNPNIFEG